VEEVIKAFTDAPNSSIRSVSRNVEMPSKSSIQRILKDAKFHPYRLQLCQKLRPQDWQRRVDHALTQLARMTVDLSFLQNLQFSDEAHFHLDGTVNRQNFRYWHTSNPFFYAEQPLHSPRITVWAAIGIQGIVGPIFFQENVTGESYLQLLQQRFLPVVQTWPSFPSMIFMQDGAPPHWSLAVRNFLSVTYPSRWMGRSSPNLPWPPYSPDLTPMDFFLWGWVKDRIYRTPVGNLNELRVRIEQAFQALPMDMVHRAISSYPRRLQLCLDCGGRSVELYR
jgi:transposase